MKNTLNSKKNNLLYNLEVKAFYCSFHCHFTNCFVPLSEWAYNQLQANIKLLIVVKVDNDYI